MRQVRCRLWRKRFNLGNRKSCKCKEENEYLDEPLWTDTIYATVEIPDGADKLLEDDVITFWGTCDGDYTYETVMGNNVSLPKIDIKYYELNN